MMSTKNNILKRLRSGQKPFANIQPITEHNIIAPMDDVDLLERFVQQAEALSTQVHQLDNEQSAIDTLMTIIGDDKTVLAWEFNHIPLANLRDHLQKYDIEVADSRDASVRVGITGAEVALAATGSLVISAKEGKPRTVSLLPHVHVAIITREQILPHFDAWIEQQARSVDDFRKIGNHVVITGASRTADIGMVLVLGAHGPAELHIIILEMSL